MFSPPPPCLWINFQIILQWVRPQVRKHRFSEATTENRTGSQESFPRVGHQTGTQTLRKWFFEMPEGSTVFNAALLRMKLAGWEDGMLLGGSSRLVQSRIMIWCWDAFFSRFHFAILWKVKGEKYVQRLGTMESLLACVFGPQLSWMGIWWSLSFVLIIQWSWRFLLETARCMAQRQVSKQQEVPQLICLCRGLSIKYDRSPGSPLSEIPQVRTEFLEGLLRSLTPSSWGWGGLDCCILLELPVHPIRRGRYTMAVSQPTHLLSQLCLWEWHFF